MINSLENAAAAPATVCKYADSRVQNKFTDSEDCLGVNGTRNHFCNDEIHSHNLYPSTLQRSNLRRAFAKLAQIFVKPVNHQWWIFKAVLRRSSTECTAYSMVQALICPEFYLCIHSIIVEQGRKRHRCGAYIIEEWTAKTSRICSAFAVKSFKRLFISASHSIHFSAL